MADHSKIEWTDATWNIVTGCEIVSPGCTNCYAMKLAGARLKTHPSRAGLTKPSRSGPVWTGEVRFNEQWLDQPLRWRKPRMIFVAAHGDLFHPGVPDEVLDKVFAVMALARHHTFQVLTKRPERMREYVTDREDREIGRAMDRQLFGPTPVPVLPNLWLGVSVEDQQRADERIPHLLATPATKRFVSAEPLLGPIDLDEWLHDSDCQKFGDGCSCRDAGGPFEVGLDWVIVGGESQAGARPMHPDWARSLRDQCAAAGVAFLFKQWGDWVPYFQLGNHWKATRPGGFGQILQDDDPMFEGRSFQTRWIEDGHTGVCRLGKKAAGRLLDGRTHDEVPA